MRALFAALVVTSATLFAIPAPPLAASVAHAVPLPPAKVIATSGNGSAIVAWSNPAPGVPITAFVVTPYHGKTADRPRVFAASGRVAVVTGLKNGVSFLFRVAARNTAGSGAESAASNVIIVGTPSVPTGVRASMPAARTLEVSFSAPASNGAAITGYTATCRSSNGGVTTTGTGVASPVTVANLTAGKTYACTVAAVNSRGRGLPSAPSVTALPQPGGVVAEPGIGHVIVSWNPLRSTGVTYVVSSSPAGRGCRVVDVASCRIAVTDSTPWRFSLTEMDASGSSPPSPYTSALRHRLLLVVAGQSNAVGTESYASDPTTFNDYFSPPYANGADSASTISWVPSSHGGLLAAPASGPVSIDTPQMLDKDQPIQVFRPEIGLARQLWTDGRQPVTIVKAAIGSTSLAVDWDPSRAGGFYSQMINQVRATISAEAKTGVLDTIGAFYWYQGEDDATNTSWYSTYQSNLAAFITHLRRDLPMNAAAPIVLAKESSAARIAFRQASAECPPDDCAAYQAGDNAVRAADDWAAANLPDVGTVDTLDLARAPELIHLSNLGELALGENLAVATEGRFP